MDGSASGRIKCTLANWTEAVVFSISNNSFGPTEISYLEKCFCNLATQANRYEVKNGNDPTPGNITEEKESELEGFIDYAKVIMGTLGHKVFEPLNRVTPEKGKEIYETIENGRLLLKRTIKNVCAVGAEGKQILHMPQCSLLEKVQTG